MAPGMVWVGVGRDRGWAVRAATTHIFSPLLLSPRFGDMAGAPWGSPMWAEWGLRGGRDRGRAMEDMLVTWGTQAWLPHVALAFGHVDAPHPTR